MTKEERAAKVAEIRQEMASRSIPGRDRENIRALLAIVAELERDLKHVQGSDVAMMELLNTARGERDCAFKNLEDRTSERNSFAASLCAERTKVAKLRDALVELLDAVDTHDKANGKRMLDKHATENARAVSAEMMGDVT